MRLAALAILALVALPAHASQDCRDCHAQAERSFTLSKHGVLARLHPGRAPGCVECHPQAAGGASIHPGKAAGRVEAPPDPGEMCRRCHAPRYIREHLATAERGRAIGRMKLAEAEAVLGMARAEMRGEALAGVEAIFERMRSVSMVNLRLGLAHQSPDYQWWHGQAALDGDLLHLKGALGEARRSPSGTGGRRQ